MNDRRVTHRGARHRRWQRALRAHADARLRVRDEAAISSRMLAERGENPHICAMVSGVMPGRPQGSAGCRLRRRFASRAHRFSRICLAPSCGGRTAGSADRANGAGKTNLLEAISFLAPGRGLRRAEARRHLPPRTAGAAQRHAAGRLGDCRHRDDAARSGCRSAPAATPQRQRRAPPAACRWRAGRRAIPRCPSI